MTPGNSSLSNSFVSEYERLRVEFPDRVPSCPDPLPFPHLKNYAILLEERPELWEDIHRELPLAPKFTFSLTALVGAAGRPFLNGEWRDARAVQVAQGDVHVAIGEILDQVVTE